MKITFRDYLHKSFASLIEDEDRIKEVVQKLKIFIPGRVEGRNAVSVWGEIIDELFKCERIDDLFDCSVIQVYVSKNRKVIFCQIISSLRQDVWTSDLLQSIYVQCVSKYDLQGMPTFIINNKSDTNNKDIIRKEETLLALLQQKNSDAAIEMILRLAQNAPLTVREQFNELVNALSHIPDLGIGNYWREQLDKSTRNSINDTHPTYLTVMIEPSLNSVPETYHMAVFPEVNIAIPKPIERKKPLKFIDLAKLLNETINACMAVCNPASLSLEFVLPLSLLLQKPDSLHSKWQLPDEWHIPGSTITFGKTFPIAYRSLERLKEKWMWPQWHKRGIPNSTSGRIFWVDAAHNFARKKATDRLFQNKLYTEIEWSCVGFPFFLTEDNEHLLVETLEAGISLSFWCRRGEANIIFDEGRKQTLSENLHQLPNLLRDWRNHMDEQNKHIAHHLTLLHDDPNRKPNFQNYRLSI